MSRRFDVAPHDVPAQQLDGGDLYVVTSADGERERVALEPVGGVDAERHVSRGGVGVGVHRIRPVCRTVGVLLFRATLPGSPEVEIEPSAVVDREPDPARRARAQGARIESVKSSYKFADFFP
ncbi:hypothetical protein QE406_001147 [Microbacterium testaceum]|jgi:hypothetical protein|nr:hypothetical protein [Microbacterium sp. SORGH_AS_0969]MDQ1115138.1 hypothetical protein [Microbacterium testaceum]